MRENQESLCQLKENTEGKFLFNIFSAVFCVVRNIKKFQI